MKHRLWHTRTTLLSILFLYGCGSSVFDVRWFSASDSDNTVEVVQVEDSPTPAKAPAAAPELAAPSADELWQSALDSGMSAARLAQNAISPQDWELVSSRWERALKILEAIPEDASNYAEAQAKIEQYQQNQQIAQQHYQQLTAQIPTTAAAARPASNDPADSVPQTAAQTAQPTQAMPSAAQPQRISDAAIALCQGVQSSPAGQPMEIANIRFYRPPSTPYDFGSSGFEADPSEDYMIGCLTNNTGIAFSSAAIEFSSKMAGGGGFFSGGLDLPVEAIQPGATVPFRGPFGIDPETTEITIEKLIGMDSSYQPVETVEPQLTISYSPTPATPAQASPDRLCASVRPVKSNQAFEVNALQLYTPPHDPYNFGADQGSYLVGCVTNHSNEPLSELGMTYSHGQASGGGSTVSIPGNIVQPGQTVPFRKYGNIDADEPSITVETVSSNLGEITIGTTLTR